MRRISQIVIIVLAGLFLYSIANQHFRSACYATPTIKTKEKAIEAAKELIVKTNIFAFPGVGTSRDFVASLADKPRCCEAIEEFSLIYFSTIWTVHLVSSQFATFIVMSGCGEKILDRGSVAIY
jgi:imidazoleglycerol phosphate synthase glutamine amidotransferase subunit HisH